MIGFYFFFLVMLWNYECIRGLIYWWSLSIYDLSGFLILLDVISFLIYEFLGNILGLNRIIVLILKGNIERFKE